MSIGLCPKISATLCHVLTPKAVRLRVPAAQRRCVFECRLHPRTPRLKAEAPVTAIAMHRIIRKPFLEKKMKKSMRS